MDTVLEQVIIDKTKCTGCGVCVEICPCLYSVIALGYPAVTYLRPANRKVVVPRILGLTETYPGKVHGGE
jgi:ferredoxin